MRLVRFATPLACVFALMSMPASADVNSPGWGFYSSLPGTYWRGEDGTVASYEWILEGEVLEVHVLTDTTEERRRFTLDPSGESMRGTKSGSVTVPVRPGVMQATLVNGNRAVARLVGDKYMNEESQRVGGEWRPVGSWMASRITSSQAIAAMAELKQKRELAAEASKLQAQKTAEADAALALKWGPFWALAGLRTVSQDGTKAWNYSWLTRGKEFNIFAHTPGASLGSNFKYTLEPDGRIHVTSDNADFYGRASGPRSFDYAVRGKQYRQLVTRNTNGTFTFEEYRVKPDGSLKTKPVSTMIERVISREEGNQFAAAYKEKQRQERIAEQAAAERRSQSGGGGGFFKVLQGAVAGAQGIASGGGGVDEVLSGAGIGAIAGAAGVDAGTINSATSTVISGSTSGASLGAIASGGSAGGGTYTKKPNMIAGQSACSDMTPGGNDVQLKTMCAQAQEYYAMYERAIGQGYSETDANRTYSAHEQAAQNALSFYANNRAD